MNREDKDPEIGTWVRYIRVEGIYKREVIGKVAAVSDSSLTITDRRDGKRVSVRRLKYRGFADVTILNQTQIATVEWWATQPKTRSVFICEPRTSSGGSILTSMPRLSIHGLLDVEADAALLDARRQDLLAVEDWIRARPVQIATVPFLSDSDSDSEPKS